MFLKNEVIVPLYEELCHELKNNIKLNENDKYDHLVNNAFRKYFMDVVDTLCLFIDPSTLDQQVTIDIQKIFDIIPSETLKRNELKFFERAKYLKGTSSSICYYCKMADQKNEDYDDEYGTLEMKLNNKYSRCCSKFGLLRENDLKLFEINKDFIQKYSNLKYFSLKDLPLDSAASFNKLKHLIDIKLENNNINHLPVSIWEVKTLKSLSVKNNSITSFNKDKKLDLNAFLVYEYFETFEADNLRLEMNHDQLILMPSSLTNLILKNLQSNFIPLDLKNCQNSLKSLIVTGVPWIDTTVYSSFKMWMITKENFSTRYEHFFSKDQIKNIFHYFDMSKDGALNPDEVSTFNAFVFKKFQRIEEFPPIIFTLTNLTRLDLSFQSIKVLPDSIESLTNLNKLILAHCILLDNLTPKISSLPLKKLDLNGCISLKTPPPEIVKRGLASILSFLKRLLTGSVLCKKTKLMLVNLI